MDKNNKTRKQKRKIDDNCCNKNISSNSQQDETHNVVNENNETMNKLKDILDNSKTNYEKEVMALNTLKEAHIYCKIHKLSGQVTGALVENFIKYKYKMEKNCASKCIGDLKHNNIDIEIKVSNGGKDNNKFNFVQIRMNHTCEYLLTAYYLDYTNVNTLGELYLFKLNKNDIKKIILDHGGYAHGTITKLGKITKDDLDKNNNEKEYALRPKYGDNCWKRLLEFRINNIDEITI